MKSRLLFCVVQVNRISLLSPSWRSWCYQGNEIISAAPSQPCQVQQLTSPVTADTKQDISGLRGELGSILKDLKQTYWVFLPPFLIQSQLSLNVTETKNHSCTY